MDEEQSKDFVGYKGRYRVSNQGRFRSEITHRILKPAPTSKGYSSVLLYDGSRPKNPHSSCVHDLVMAAFVGPMPAGYQMDHGLKGKRCNALDNLEYVTASENIRRFYARGGKKLGHRGPDHANAKLTADQVCRLRRLAVGGELHTARFAREFDVSCATVADAAKGRTYKNVVDHSLAV